MADLDSRPDKPRPVNTAKRIPALDVLRGVAVLGILVMNVQSFSMPFAAYSNPAFWTSGDTEDLFFWGLGFIFAEQKFMTLFSLLFGSGVALMLERLERRRAQGMPVSPAAIHYRRTLGLLLIGLAHAYLLWFGDILVSYALCALALYPLRRVRPSRLLAAGLVLLMVPPLLSQGMAAVLETLPEERQQEVVAEFMPTEADVVAESDAYRRGWLEQMPLRSSTALMLQTWIFFFFVLWRAGGLMLVGMAFYRWGIVTAGRSRAFYRWLLLAGFLGGFPLVLMGVDHNLVEGFTFQSVWRGTSVYNYFGSLGVALGYLALVMLWTHRSGNGSGELATAPRGATAPAEAPQEGTVPEEAAQGRTVLEEAAQGRTVPEGAAVADGGSDALPETTTDPGDEAPAGGESSPLAPAATPTAPPGGLRGTLAAVGRMALTNYLLQTILCTALFYGWGLGLYGHLDRGEQWLVILAVWAFQLVASPWWLARFRFGPFEWLWRSVTYLRWQPLRR